ncbi:putative secreted protein (Por secretion system target) [Winogradskyella eximia]|uniref:Putative secreted protein (Por secretion system target) n=1 Tax=Winogradskyella eximia TaxID=262006 RepID=A0A3D9GZU2_9FLAO|nr:PKD domain-containing protein [Winogradskyella eximia]RED42113.1 putative secreted protein (Por secretion system target) [Winogradskyella eximia]
MKNLLRLLFLMLGFCSFGQDVLMQNGTITACSGTFYDAGGEFANYADNESYIITICPEEIGQRTRLDFQEFSTQLNTDFLTIYDGDDVSAPSLGVYSGTQSPGLLIATFDNLTGCLTIEFTSNSTDNEIGWAANISCTTPCQEITSLLDSTFPIANAEGIIEVCIGDNINLSGSGIFETDGTGASYTWDLGDGNTASGQTINVSYNIPGVYLVNLDIRDTNTDDIIQGCPNTNSINLVIRVSGEPDFLDTQATDNTLCFGETTTLVGVVNPLTLVYNCPPPESELTFLPDGSGAAYSTSINVTCFDSAQVLTDVSQIESICLNMEHSYLGDLDIEIVSPNGQVVRLHDQGGGSANLGIPWATGTVDGNSFDVTPGNGFDYCFVPNGGFPTLVNGIQSGGAFPIGNDPDIYIDTYVPEGNYSSVNSLEGLLGSPLNGNWTIYIVDNLAQDNGYIFSWELNFDNNLQLEDFDFVPAIVSQSWDSDSSITEVNGSTITVAPDSAGEFCYTFRTVDIFGCEYTKEVCVNVTEEGAPPITYYEDLDGDGYGDPNSSIEDCSDTPPLGYVVNGLDCNDTNGLINPEAEDSEGNAIDENCDGVDGDTLGLEDFNLDDIKVLSNPFSDHLIINVPTILNGSQLNITIYDLNGRRVYHNKHSVSTNQITINNLDELGKSTYLLEISNEEFGLNIVKKLVKL